MCQLDADANAAADKGSPFRLNRGMVGTDLLSLSQKHNCASWEEKPASHNNVFPDQPISTCKQVSLHFKSALMKLIAKKSSSLVQNNFNRTARSECFPAARSFTSTKTWEKKGEMNLLCERDAAFHRFLYVWSESTKGQRNWVLFKDTSNWNNVANLKINISKYLI